jgi:hypothetical protein
VSELIFALNIERFGLIRISHAIERGKKKFKVHVKDNRADLNLIFCQKDQTEQVSMA